MERQQILDLYQWETGVCFRHPGEGEQPTVHLKTIRPAAGGLQEIRACPSCVCELEREHETAAVKEGMPYAPGFLAEEQDD